MVPSQAAHQYCAWLVSEDIVEVTAGTATILCRGYLSAMLSCHALRRGHSTLISVEVVDEWPTAGAAERLLSLPSGMRSTSKWQAYGPPASVATGFTEVANGNTNLERLALFSENPLN